MLIRSLDDGGGGAGRPQGDGAGAASGPSASARPATAPRFEAPRGGAGGAGGARAMAVPSARPAGDPNPEAAEPGAPVRAIGTFEEVVALAVEKRDLQTKAALERDVRLVRCEDGRLEIALESGAARTLVNDLSRKLSQWTGRPWMVVVSAEQGVGHAANRRPTRAAPSSRSGVRADPLVKAVLERFPGAQIVRVKEPGDDAPEPAPLADADLPPADDEGFGDSWVRDDGND